MGEGFKSMSINELENFDELKARFLDNLGLASIRFEKTDVVSMAKIFAVVNVDEVKDTLHLEFPISVSLLDEAKENFSIFFLICTYMRKAIDEFTQEKQSRMAAEGESARF